MSLQVDLSAKRTKSLQLLQRMNGTVLEIVHDATQTAVYYFNLRTSKWEKAGVEGALFVTRNSVAPYYSVFVLNKLAPDNFSLNLDTVINVSCQAPFIMLRYSTKGAPAIAGLWFHDDTSRNEVMSAINVARDRINGVSSGLPTTSSPSKTNQLKALIGKSPAKPESSSEGDKSKTNMLKGLLGKSSDSSSSSKKENSPSLVSNGSAQASFSSAGNAAVDHVFSESASRRLLEVMKGGGSGDNPDGAGVVTMAVPTQKNDASKKLLGMLKKGANTSKIVQIEKQLDVEKEKPGAVRQLKPLEEQPKKPQKLISPSDLL